MIFKCLHLATACFKEFALHRAIWLRALHAIKKETSNLLQQEAKAADPWQVHSGPKAGEDLWEQGELNSKADSPLQANGKTMPPCKQIEMRCCCSLYLFIVVKKCTKTINKNAFPLEIPKSYLENKEADDGFAGLYRHVCTFMEGFLAWDFTTWWLLCSTKSSTFRSLGIFICKYISANLA